MSTHVNTSFTICLSRIPSCSEPISVCGINNYPNTVNTPSMGQIGCLGTSPNPTFLKVRVAQSGTIQLTLTQSSLSASSPNLDIDYAAWGPFTDPAQSCSIFNNGQVISPNSCSFSAASSEVLTLNNAVAGQYYLILATNFSNQQGFITISQSNLGATGAGTIDCSGLLLHAFLDNNGNQTYDSGEPGFPLGEFQYSYNGGDVHHAVSATGQYAVYDDDATHNYQLQFSLLPELSNNYSCTTSYTQVQPGPGAAAVYHFPVQITQSYTDVGVYLQPLSALRAGGHYTLKLIYLNDSPVSIPTGDIAFSCPQGLTLSSTSVTGVVSSGNGFTYTFTNLLPFEVRSITIILDVAPIPVLALGQLLGCTATITLPLPDALANNNTAQVSQPVVAAYDPNDKTETHGSKIVFDQFHPQTELQYVIRFENLGNAAAMNIDITDVLDAQIDENSVKVLDASHPYSFERVNNQLVWHFANIMLPVSVPDTTTGKGFVSFKAKLKPGFAIGDIIPNTASIYFDANPAVITNTYTTEFVAQLGTPSHTIDAVRMYPNPARGQLFVDTLEPLQFSISSLSGAILQRGVVWQGQAIDTSALAQGCYMVQLQGDDGAQSTRKLVIQ